MLRKRVKVFGPCCGYSTAYGTVVGAAFGALLGLLGGPVGFAIGGFAGACLGAPGGLIAGFVGALVGGRAGWTLAGFLGGSAAVLTMVILRELNDPNAIPWDSNYLGGVLLAVLVPGGVGAAVGSRVGKAIDGRETTLPGVKQVVAALDEARVPWPGMLPPPPGHGDLIPAAGPHGRGDEPAALF